MYAALLTFLGSTLHMVIVKAINGDPFFSMKTLQSLVDFVILSITVVVVAVPEGLPLAVTISLAYSVSKMRLQNNLVRSIDASETMGGADEIATDKTGTLTQNEMTVVQTYICDQKVESLAQISKQNQDLLFNSIMGNCTARIEVVKHQFLPVGNQTECGLLRFIQKYGVNPKEIQSSLKEFESIPFSSDRKKCTTVVNHPTDDQKLRVYIKGAPDYVINNCTHFVGSDGNEAELSEDKKKEVISETVNYFACQAFRTILVGYKDMDKHEFEEMKATFKNETDKQALEQNFTMVGICALQDPLRPTIKASIKACKAASIRVRMVTGDNIETAKAIAREAGIITQDEIDNNEYSFMEGE